VQTCHVLLLISPNNGILYNYKWNDQNQEIHLYRAMNWIQTLFQFHNFFNFQFLFCFYISNFTIFQVKRHFGVKILKGLRVPGRNAEVNSSWCLRTRGPEIDVETSLFPAVSGPEGPAWGVIPSLSFFFVLRTGAWTQGLHLEPLHQPFFVMGFFLR
jgi:hypothetical protein